MNATMNDDNKEIYEGFNDRLTNMNDDTPSNKQIAEDFNDDGFNKDVITDFFDFGSYTAVSWIIFVVAILTILGTIYRFYILCIRKSQNNNTNRNVSQSDAAVGGNNDIEVGGGRTDVGGGRTEVGGGRWGIGGFFGGGGTHNHGGGYNGGGDNAGGGHGGFGGGNYGGGGGC